MPGSAYFKKNYPLAPAIVQEILIYMTNSSPDSCRTRPHRTAVLKYHRRVKCYGPRGIKNMSVKHCHSYLDQKGTLVEESEAKGVEGARPADGGTSQDKDAGGNALIGAGNSMMACGCLLTLFITLPVLFILFLGGC